MADAQKPSAAVVLGAGPLGVAIAGVLRARGIPVRLWARRKAARDAAADVVPGLTLCTSVEEAVTGAGVAPGAIGIVVLGVPASGLPEVAEAYGHFAQPDHIVLHAVRGVCSTSTQVPDGNLQLAHRVIRAHTCARKIGVLGGPLYAPDLSNPKPLAVVLASPFNEPFMAVAGLTAGGSIKVHQSYDIVGVELAGAMSNVSAIAAGVAEGLDLGDTAVGVLMTRGLSETAQFAQGLGADVRTFFGLAGVGDLIPRHVASTERHREFGALLAKGTEVAVAAKKVGAVSAEGIEGMVSAREVVRYADRVGSRSKLVLARAVNALCSDKASAADILDGVLSQHLELGPAMGTV